MKTSLALVCTLITATLLLSWTFFHDTKSISPTVFSAGNSDSSKMRRPAAEDVLVQKISGDNSHVLLMAYYSKENYSEPYFTIENGFAMTLRDDGKENDKIAGDGLYTAKIPADIHAFNKQATGISKKMKAVKFKPVKYLEREKIVDPDASEDFDVAKFDANEPVSVSGLTNALSTNLKSEPASLSSGSASLAVVVPSLDAVKNKSVFITDISVVEDATRTWNFKTQKGNLNGPWTFNTLMRNLASRNSTASASNPALSDFIKKWLMQFATQQTVNGDVVAGRPLLNSVILNPWLARSLANGAPSGQLDMRFAPFKLTAITNRFDLRDGESFGNPGQPCGEARFIFTLVSSIDTVNAAKSINIHIGDPLRMNLILEFLVNKPNTCADKQAWAQQWVDLANLALPSSQYNTALQKITDQFASLSASKKAPSQNKLSQLRTNEITLEDLEFGVGTWQLRQFNLISSKTKVELKMATDIQSPADKFNGAISTSTAQNVQRFADFVNQNTNAINSGFFTVPVTFQGSPFMGAVSKVSTGPIGPTGFHWDGATSGTARITDNNARHNISMQTCSGCHGGESQTFFTHIDNVPFGQQATLSGFVSGKKGFRAADADGDDNNGVFSVADPAQRPTSTAPTIRQFNEIDRRAKDLINVVSTSCGSVLAISSQLLFNPITTVD